MKTLNEDNRNKVYKERRESPTKWLMKSKKSIIIRQRKWLEDEVEELAGRSR